MRLAGQRRRRGSSFLEFTLVCLPLIFLIISIVELARGMWLYHTLAHAIKAGTRFAIVHGKGCADASAACPVTVADVARTIRSAVLHGLNASNNAVPPSLKTFAPVVIWQDHANTTLKYNGDGTLDLSCGAPCTKLLDVPGSQQMILQASSSGGHAGVNLYGTIYSPRAAWITELGLLPGDTIAGPLQIIAGALQMAVFTKLDVTPVPTPLTRLTVSLIE